MSRETFTYDDLNVGEYNALVVSIAASQTIKRGDLLVAAATEGVPADTFAKDTAGAKIGNVYAIAAEDITTDTEVAEAVVYISGKFNKAKVTEQAKVGNELALAAQGIVLVDVRG